MPDTQPFLYTGHNIHVKFGTTTELVLYCRSVTDAPMEAGEAIDITTNATEGMKAYAPADLVEPGEISLTAAYRLEDREVAYEALNVPQDITIEYRACKNKSVGQQITYKNAFLKSYVPQDMSTGNMPEVQITIGLAGGSPIGAMPEGASPAGNLTEITAG